MIADLEKLKVPGPIPTAISRPFWDAAKAGRFTLQRCEDCGKWVFYPRSHCPHCWSPRLTWHDASGRGTVKTFSIIHRPGHPAWNAVAPYALGLIQLEEGPTMLSTLVDVDHAALHVGLSVQVRFVQVGEFALPMFVPREEV